MTFPQFLKGCIGTLKPTRHNDPSGPVHGTIAGQHYWAGRASCGICSHGWVAVVAIGLDQTEPVVPLECPGCGHLAGGPV